MRRRLIFHLAGAHRRKTPEEAGPGADMAGRSLAPTWKAIALALNTTPGSFPRYPFDGFLHLHRT